MVLDVSRAEDGVALIVGGHRTRHELLKDFLHGLPDHVREHVQPSSVRHADGDCLTAQLHRPIDHRLHSRDRRLDSLQPKPLGHAILGGKEALEVRGKRQTVVHVEDVGLGPIELVRLLELVSDPIGLLHVWDVHELNADGAAVGVLERVEDLAQRLWPPRPEHACRRRADGGGAHEELPVQVRVREAVRAMVEERRHPCSTLHVDIGR
mmetsp:Transcript_9838/g.19624  ORF Transcript_9838/g.19624 Transcript_9838/m.19624 type:complete len:209 (+) Transcript_9838:2258-2884(+)